MTKRAPLIGVIAAIVLAVGFYFLLWSPMSDEQTQYETETVTLEQQVATLEGELERLLEIQENEFEYQTKLSKLTEYIPDDPAQPVALKQFQEAADLAGVNITSLANGLPVLVEGAPATEDPELALAKIDVTMTVEGGYFQHVDLLRRLEVDVARALLVRNVSLTEGTDGFPELSATWSGEMFAVVPISAAAPAETAEGAEGTEGAEGAEEADAGTTETDAGTPPAEGQSTEPADDAGQTADASTETTS